MSAPIQSLGLAALVLSVAACAEMQQAMPSGGEQAASGSCPAEAHQDWVGKRIDVLNDVELPEGTRVLFPTTPATMDYREDRMNVEVDRSDTIARVYCG